MRILITFLLLVMGCSGTRVITLTGPAATFENYYTYRIQHPPYPEDSVASKATDLREKIDLNIRTYFDARGYSRRDPADLVVSYKLILENKVDTEINDPYRNRYDPTRISYADRYRTYPYVTERAYTEGVLLVEIREDYGKAVVWDGSLDLKYNKRKSNEDPVSNAFNLILWQYPYIAGQSDPVPIEE